MSRVTISMKAARAQSLLGLIVLYGPKALSAGEYQDVRDAVRDALRARESKRKPRKPSTAAPRPGAPGSPSIELSHPMQWTSEATRTHLKAQKREQRTSTREAVVKRAMDAGGLCECGCGEQVRDDRKMPVYPEARGEMDHFWGRGKGRPPESLETCWFLRPACHLAKTRNQPDAATWCRKFMDHCRSHGYAKMADKAHDRMMFVETRSMLGAGLRGTP